MSRFGRGQSETQSRGGKQCCGCCWRKRDRHMLGFIFGLNARLGRLHYFLATLALAVVMTVLCFLVLLSLMQTVPHGAQLSPAALYETMKWPTIALGLLFCLISFMLQS